MRVFKHQTARARIGLALAAGIALATVAVPAPAATAADGAAIEEYVATPPGVSKQAIPSISTSGDEDRGPATRPGVLNPQESGRGPVAAALGSLGEVPPALPASAAVAALCLLTCLLSARGERERAA